MRLLVCGTLLIGLSLPLLAQSSETGGDADDNSPAPRAQPVAGIGDPGASQDAEAAREKLLKASDQIDLMETNAEATKQAVDAMKANLAKIEDENTALKQQVSTLQDTVTKQQDEIDRMEAAREKERQALIDEVSALVAEKSGSHRHIDDDTPPAPKKHADDSAPDTASDSTATHDTSASLAPPADATSSGPVHMPADLSADDSSSASTAAALDSSADTPPATPHPRKGYYHVVAPHETLSLICEAYRDHGVNVTVAQIRRANGLTSRSALKVGQKLFIPRPGA